jgi:hypothetical protein
MKSILPVLIGLSLALSLNGYSLYERESLGNPTGSFDARSAAMGGFGVADGSSLLQTSANPASLAFMPGLIQFQATGGFIWDNDRRSLALYDSFDEIVDEGTYAENDHLYPNFALGAALHKNMKGYGIGVGFAMRPLLNFDCNYSEEVRTDDTQDNNTFPPVIAINSMKGTGDLYAYGINLALDTESVPYLEKLGLGLEIAPLSGSHTLMTDIIWTEAAKDSIQHLFTLPDKHEKMHAKFDGTRITLGARAQVNGRLGLGFTLSPKTEVNADITTTTYNAYEDVYETETTDSPKLILPSTMHWGLSYQPRNVARTVFNVDMEWVKWTDVNRFYDNSMRYSFGVEHRLGDSMPLRLGFRYETSPLDNSLAMPTFTAGAGFELMNHWTIDVSGEFSNRNYQALDLFPDSYYDDTQYTEAIGYVSPIWNYVVPKDRDWSNPDKVEESFVKVMTSLSFHW